MNSMTSFAYKERQIKDFTLTLLIKSYNFKGLELDINIVPELEYLEKDFKSKIKEFVKRGKIKLKFNIQSNYNINKDLDYDIEFSILKDSYDYLNKLIKYLNIDDTVKLNHLLLKYDINKIKLFNLTKSLHFNDEVFLLFNETLDIFLKHKKEEGKEIQKDILLNIKNIYKSYNDIEKELPRVEDKIREYINDNLNKFIDKKEDDNLSEISYYIIKHSINEEMIRFKIYIDELNNFIYNKDVFNAKKVDFFCQELNREINTVASKNILPSIGKNTVEIKSSIDNIREHIKNIE